jgi:hypothetical protein
MNEIKGEFHDVLIISELRGGYPDVQIASDVDYAGLIAGDPTPVFLTLPIGKAGVTSGNKRHYDEVWLQELERQTLTGKPVGLMGHLSTTDRAHSFPPEAIHWVGALREGDTLWGKGYVPPGEARQRIQRYKAQGKKIATSIDAYAEGAWDESLKAYRMTAASMKLNQIDIAPADRAGISDLAAVPALSTEMNTSAETPQEDQQEDDPAMDKLTIINEMTAEDARLLPDSVRAAIVAAVPTPAEVALIAELRTELGLEAGADIKAHVAEMKTTQETQRKAAITNRIKELVEDGIKVADVRGVVTELVEAKQPKTLDEVQTAYNAVSTSATVTALLGARVVETMGPAQGTPVQGQQGKNKYFVLPA